MTDDTSASPLPQATTPSLSPALQELLEKVVEYPDADITELARLLFKSPGTVRTQMQTLYQRLEVTSRAGVVTRAWQWNLLPQPTSIKVCSPGKHKKTGEKISQERRT